MGATEVSTTTAAGVFTVSVRMLTGVGSGRAHRLPMRPAFPAQFHDHGVVHRVAPACPPPPPRTPIEPDQGRLFSDAAIDRLAEQVGVTDVPGRLLDEMEQNPA